MPWGGGRAATPPAAAPALTALPQKPARCNASAPSPRVYVYHLPRASFAPATSYWRNARALVSWVTGSAHHESDGDCADYYLVPTHPVKRLNVSRDVLVGRLFGHIRATWPWWNRTVRAGEARHLWLLPCDHGPGDCAYSRPLVPFKYSLPRSAKDEVHRTWGVGWEALNPASPARLVITLRSIEQPAIPSPPYAIYNHPTTSPRFHCALPILCAS